MISKILYALENGFAVMRSNSKMFLVGILVFVFPISFFLVTNNFFETANENIETVKKQKVGTFHDSIRAVLKSESGISSSAISIADRVFSDPENYDLKQIVLFKVADDKVNVLYSTSSATGISIEDVATSFSRATFGKNVTFTQFDFVISGGKVSHNFSVEQTETGPVYLFTLHDYRTIDSTLLKRMQESYVVLTFIFAFLILLAYWLNRQENWQVKHAKLSTILKERDMFSNMIAHEFRTPLTVIKGYASFLEESTTIPDEEMRYVKNIHSSTERLVLLVNDFLEVARLQSGKLEIDKDTFNLNETINKVCEDLQTLAKEKGLDLNTENTKATLPFVSDQKRVTQILINIITNAIKYTDSGSVTLETRVKRDNVVILVKDTGMGISADDQRKLFTPFTRVGDVDKNSKTTGTGLGMWITKQLIAVLGGTIGVESIKGVGTHIVITFEVDGSELPA